MSVRIDKNLDALGAVYKALRMHLPVEQAVWALGQAALESGWFSSQLACVAKNYWGIKATSGWKGAIWTGPTHEVEKGTVIKIHAGFRAYPTTTAGVADYLSLMQRLYSNPLGQSSFPFFLQKLQGRWATDPNYASKVLAAIEKVRLLIPSEPNE